MNFTFAGSLYNPQMEYKSLKLKERRGTATMVAEAFTGNGNYGWSSVEQSAQTSMQLPLSAIDTIREIAIPEDPKLCMRNH